MIGRSRMIMMIKKIPNRWRIHNYYSSSSSHLVYLVQRDLKSYRSNLHIYYIV